MCTHLALVRSMARQRFLFSWLSQLRHQQLCDAALALPLPALPAASSPAAVLWELCTRELPVRGQIRDIRIPQVQQGRGCRQPSSPWACTALPRSSTPLRAVLPHERVAARELQSLRVQVIIMWHITSTSARRCPPALLPARRRRRKWCLTWCASAWTSTRPSGPPWRSSSTASW